MLIVSIVIGVIAFAAICMVAMKMLGYTSSESKQVSSSPNNVAICVGCSIHPPISPAQSQSCPCAKFNESGTAYYEGELVPPEKAEGGVAHEPRFDPVKFGEEGPEEVEIVTFGQPARINGIAESTTKPVTREYEYYPMLDSYGADITQLPSLVGDVEGLKLACDEFPHCRGFTTGGQMKYDINPANEWVVYSDDPKKGLYVVKGALQ